MRLVVLGAPGAGKGTQARSLAKHYNITHVSTGDILREHMRNKTAIGVSINDLMNEGRLVPDELIIGLVKERIQEEDCGNGYILDGFPRTLVQAKAYDIMSKEMELPIDRVISVDVADDIIVERMSGRLVCPGCGAMYHLTYYPSKKEDVCDVCSTGLIQREDDKAKTVKDRLAIYHEMTVPIIEYYENKGILYRVSGVGDMNEITESIIKNLSNRWLR